MVGRWFIPVTRESSGDAREAFGISERDEMAKYKARVEKAMPVIRDLVACASVPTIGAFFGTE